jgi:NADPH:quinone reductase-like Zn-dependent oxidoreductase
MPIPSEGEVLIQNDWLSLDPYMRSRISDAKSYAKGVNPGDVMVGGAVGTVIESRSDAFSVGDTVLAASGWRLYAKMPAQAVTKIDTSRVRASAYLGVLGMPGITAWTGLYFFVFERVGFLLSTGVFLFALMSVFNAGHRLTNLCTAAGFTIGAWLLFTRVLSVRLPQGILPF